MESRSSNLAIGSLVLGIFSIFLSFVMPKLGIITSISAIGTGILAMKKIEADRKLKGKIFAIIGIVLGAFFLLFALIVIMSDIGSLSDYVEEKSIIEKINNSLLSETNISLNSPLSLYTKNNNNSIVWVKYQVESSFFSEEGRGSGVIISNDDKKLMILSNRHVIDCTCNYREIEEIYVGTNDGQKHKVSKVYFAPGKLDLVVLEIDSESAKEYPAAEHRDNLKINHQINALGFPVYVEDIFEFSTARGLITGFSDVFTREGFAFQTIESEVYTNFGSSGGGLFDTSGYFVGITTWGNSEESIGIRLSSIIKNGNLVGFKSCNLGYYLNEEDKCIEYKS